MLTFKTFIDEGFIHKTKKNPAGDIQHDFEFSSGSSKPTRVQVNHAPKSSTGFVYVPGSKGDVNKVGTSGIRNMIRAVKAAIPQLKTLKGPRNSGAGPGRVQSVRIREQNGLV